MKLVVLLLILAGLFYGGQYLYEQGYFKSFMTSVDNTVDRTSGFVTDKAVNEANF